MIRTTSLDDTDARRWQVGDMWRYANGTVVTVLDVGPHVGPDWFGGRGVTVRYADGRVVSHATAVGRWDTLVSRKAPTA